MATKQLHEINGATLKGLSREGRARDERAEPVTILLRPTPRIVEPGEFATDEDRALVRLQLDVLLGRVAMGDA